MFEKVTKSLTNSIPSSVNIVEHNRHKFKTVRIRNVPKPHMDWAEFTSGLKLPEKGIHNLTTEDLLLIDVKHNALHSKFEGVTVHALYNIFCSILYHATALDLRIVDEVELNKVYDELISELDMFKQSDEEGDYHYMQDEYFSTVFMDKLYSGRRISLTNYNHVYEEPKDEHSVVNVDHKLVHHYSDHNTLSVAINKLVNDIIKSRYHEVAMRHSTTYVKKKIGMMKLHRHNIQNYNLRVKELEKSNTPIDNDDTGISEYIGNIKPEHVTEQNKVLTEIRCETERRAVAINTKYGECVEASEHLSDMLKNVLKSIRIGE